MNLYIKLNSVQTAMVAMDVGLTAHQIEQENLHVSWNTPTQTSSQPEYSYPNLQSASTLLPKPPISQYTPTQTSCQPVHSDPNLLPASTFHISQYTPTQTSCQPVHSMSASTLLPRPPVSQYTSTQTSCQPVHSFPYLS